MLLNFDLWPVISGLCCLKQTMGHCAMASKGYNQRGVSGNAQAEELNGLILFICVLIE
jgi:hypothetical protein